MQVRAFFVNSVFAIFIGVTVEQKIFLIFNIYFIQFVNVKIYPVKIPIFDIAVVIFTPSLIITGVKSLCNLEPFLIIRPLGIFSAWNSNPNKLTGVFFEYDEYKAHHDQKPMASTFSQSLRFALITPSY